jgi:MFS superfamily sulfate permease-like transporter
LSPPTSPVDGAFLGIEEAAQEAARLADAVTPEDRIASLEGRLASIEPLLEQLQAQSELGSKIQKYVASLQYEQTFFNYARWVLGLLWLVIIIGFAWLLRDAVYHPKSPLLGAPPIAIATFIIGMVSGIVLLLSSFVKGVFRTTSERHADGFLPPTLNAALEAYQKIIGKPN